MNRRQETYKEIEESLESNTHTKEEEQLILDDLYNQQLNKLEQDRWEEEQKQTKFDEERGGPTWCVVLRRTVHPPMTFVARQPIEGLQRNDIIVNLQDFTDESAAKLHAEYIRRREIEKLGVEIILNKHKTDGQQLWRCEIGGRTVATCEDVCLICRHYRGCDYFDDSCGVLS